MIQKLILVYSILLLGLISCGSPRPASSTEILTPPTFQIASGRIAFTSSRDNGGCTVYVVNSDGTNLTRVTDPDLCAALPRWASTCDKVAFSTRDGVFLVNPDGSDLKKLLDIPNLKLNPFSWSPDGEKIAFFARDETLQRGNNIWIVNRDGSEKQQLTHCSISCSLPIWSPNGDVIFYLSDENDYTDPPIRTTLNRTDEWGTNHEVWLSASEMADIVLGSIPSISPDGTRFVLARKVDEEEHTDIFTLDITSKEWTRLTNDQAYHEQPAWSPDGQQIVFVSYHVPEVETTRQFPSTAGIWIMNADGSGRFQVVKPDGKNFAPDWCVP